MSFIFIYSLFKQSFQRTLFHSLSYLNIVSLLINYYYFKNYTSFNIFLFNN